MRADSTERQEPGSTLDSHRTPEPFHFSSYYPPRAEARTSALSEAERALNPAPQRSQMNDFENSKHPSGLPKLEIHLDDKLNYFAEHSLLIDKARRIGYDFEHSPQIAKAVWGGKVVTLASTVIGIAILKNPAAAACLASTGSEALGFGAIGGMFGGSALQSCYTSYQLRDQLPSSRLPNFKAVRMHLE